MRNRHPHPSHPPVEQAGEEGGWPIGHRARSVNSHDGWRAWKDHTWRRLLISGLLTTALFLVIPLCHLTVLYFRGAGDSRGRSAPGGEGTSSARDAGQASDPAEAGDVGSTREEPPAVSYGEVRGTFVSVLGEEVWRSDDALRPLLREVIWICRHPIPDRACDGEPGTDPLLYLEAAHHLERLAHLGVEMDPEKRQSMRDVGRELVGRAVSAMELSALGSPPDVSSDEEPPLNLEPLVLEHGSTPLIDPVLLEEGESIVLGEEMPSVDEFTCSPGGTLLVATREEAYLVDIRSAKWERLGDYEAHLAPLVSYTAGVWCWIDWDHEKKVFALRLEELSPRGREAKAMMSAGDKVVEGSRRLGEGAPFIEAYAFSPGGGRLAYSSGRQVTVVNTASGEEELVRALPLITRLAFSPDGRRLACVKAAPAEISSRTTPVSVLSLPGETRAEAHPFPELPSQFIPLSGTLWSPDGKYLVGGWREEGGYPRVVLYHPATGERHPLCELPGEPGHSELAWSPDGTELLVTGRRIESLGTSSFTDPVGAVIPEKAALSSGWERIELGSLVSPPLINPGAAGALHAQAALSPFSADGRWLALPHRLDVMSEEGEEKWTIWIHDSRGGAPVPVGGTYSKVRRLGWLPGGIGLLILADDYPSSADGSAPTRVLLRPLTAAVRGEPDALERLDRGREHLVGDRLGEAIASLRDALRLAPGGAVSREAHWHLGRAYEQAGLLSADPARRARFLAAALWEYGEVVSEEPARAGGRPAFLRAARGELDALAELVRCEPRPGSGEGAPTPSARGDGAETVSGAGLAMIVGGLEDRGEPKGPAETAGK